MTTGSGQSRGVSGWRIALRGLSDTLENLLAFTLASLTWWLGVVLVLFAPAVTQALFQAADPRLATSADPPGVSGAFRHPFSGAGKTWAIALLAGVPILVLVSNLRVYASDFNGWSLLVPLWLIILISLVLIGMVALSHAALLESSTGTALRIAAALVIGQPGRVLSMLAVMLPVCLLGAAAVVPIFTLLPAMIAATVNRFVLVSLAVPMADPLAPTDERRIEESIEQAQANAARRFGP